MIAPGNEKAHGAGGAEGAQALDAPKEFEIAYRYGHAEGDDADKAKELNYPNESAIDLPKEMIAQIKEEDAGKRTQEGDAKDVADLSIYFTFFEPSMNYAALKFTYTFTQTYDDASDLLGLKQARESVEFTQEFSTVLKIKSIQPFDILWGLVRSSDPFLRINDPQPHVPGQQPSLPASELKTALDQKFKVWCKVRNVSTSKPLKITSTALQLVLGTGEQEEDLEDAKANQKIRKARTISLLAQGTPLDAAEATNHNSIRPREQIQFMSESVTITGVDIEHLFNN